MAYLFRTKLDLRDLYEEAPRVKLILVVEPEENLLDLYCYYFNNCDFQAVGCKDLDLLFHLIVEIKPHLLVVNTKFLEDGRFEKLKQYLPWAKILSIGYNSDASAVKKAMACGASSHIDRQTTKPMDIVHIAKSILEYY